MLKPCVYMKGSTRTGFFSAAAAAAKSLQSCLTLCDPIDGSPPGSLVPGILQARTLEWVAIAFSSARLTKNIAYVTVCSVVSTLGDPVHCSPPDSSVHGISQARILEWVAIPFSRRSSRPRDQTRVSWLAGRCYTTVPLGKPKRCLGSFKEYSAAAQCFPGPSPCSPSILFSSPSFSILWYGLSARHCVGSCGHRGAWGRPVFLSS